VLSTSLCGPLIAGRTTPCALPSVCLAVRCRLVTQERTDTESWNLWYGFSIWDAAYIDKIEPPCISCISLQAAWPKSWLWSPVTFFCPETGWHVPPLNSRPDVGIEMCIIIRSSIIIIIIIIIVTSSQGCGVLVYVGWLIEQGLTSHQTHYRSYRGRFLQVI